MTPNLKKLHKQIKTKLRRTKHNHINAMTFDQFLKLSLASPNWRKLGRRKTDYCFCRRDHTKGYTPQNTFIGRTSANIRERNHRCGPPRGKRLYHLSLKRRATRLRKLARLRARRWRNKHREHLRAYYKNYRTKKRAAASTPQTELPNPSSSTKTKERIRLATYPLEQRGLAMREKSETGKQNLLNYALTNRTELAERGRRALAQWKAAHPERYAEIARRNLIKARAKRWPK